MNNQAVPPGYSVIDEGNHRRVISSGLEEQMRSLMTSSFEELARQPEASPVSTGRANPIHLPAPDSSARVFIRPYAHGGWLGRFAGRAFSSPGRAYRELAVCHRAVELQLPVCPLIGLTIHRLPARQWHMEAWSWWIANTRPLSLALAEPGGSPDSRAQLMAQVAVALQRCHDAGLLHGDLNARNILIEQAPGNCKVWITDLDQARLVPNLTTADRLRQLKRLFRSLTKEAVIPQPMPAQEFAAFVNAYFDKPGGEEFTPAQLNRFLANCQRTAFWHSWLWKAAGALRRLSSGK